MHVFDAVMKVYEFYVDHGKSLPVILVFISHIHKYGVGAQSGPMHFRDKWVVVKI